MAIENKSYDEFCEILNKKINLGELITIEENLENLGMKDKTLEDFLEEEGIFQRMSKTEKLEKVGELKNFYSKRRGSGASEKSKLLESYRIILNDINKEKEYDNYLKKAKYVGVNQILKNSKEVYKRDGILRLNQIENYVSQINLKIKNESDARNIFYGFCRQEGIPYTVERDYKNTENENKESQEDEEEKYERNYNSDSNDTENENRRSQEDRKERYRRNYNSNSNEIKVAMVIAVLVVSGFFIYNYINTRDERYIDKGVEYLDLGKKEEAEKWFKKAVKENKYMSSLVASIYEVKGDDDKAAEEWYLKSAEDGNSEAMYDLGEFYNRKGDKEKSKIWYIKVIEKQKSEGIEHLDAMIKLGDIYYKDGNKKKAKEMYENAAKKGDLNAMAKLGSIYYEEGDKERGKELLQKSAEKGNLDAKKILEKVE